MGIAIGDEALWASFRDLEARASPIEMLLGGQKIRIFFEKDALTAWAEDLDGNLLPGVLVYKEGWFAFFPDSIGVVSRRQ